MARRLDEQKMKERLENIVRAKKGCVSFFLWLCESMLIRT